MKNKYCTIEIEEGLDIFYREAGDSDKPTILMLHGFPSSSHMFRDLITLLSDDYHIVAPDYPAFGLSASPDKEVFEYSFDNISTVIEEFIDKLELSSFYLLMQDYGGPIGFRIAIKRPELIKGLIIQNANAYLEGLGEWSTKIGNYQKNDDLVGLSEFTAFLISDAGIKEQYLAGRSDVESVNPASYLTDIAFMNRKGIREKQIQLFSNYGTNFPKYEEWQRYLKAKQPDTLVVWGSGDKFFSKNGGKAYAKDLPKASVHFFNSGHFMLEEYAQEVSQLIRDFIK